MTFNKQFQPGDFAQFVLELSRQTKASRDFLVESQSMTLEIETDGRSAVPTVSWSDMPGDLGQLPLTPHARGQMASRLGIQKKLLDRLLETPEYHAPLSHLVHQIWKTEPKTTLVRSLDGNARALLSDRYRRIDNLTVMNSVMPALDSGQELQVERCHISDSMMYFRAVFPKLQADIGLGDTVQAGVMISNSEVGRASFRVEPFILRLVCLNGMISPVSIRKTHVGRLVQVQEGTELFTQETVEADDRALALAMRDIVASAMDVAHFESQVNAAREAQGIKVDRPIQAAREITKRYDLGESNLDALVNLFTDSSVPGVQEAGQTAWGMVNAITALAKQQEDFTKAMDLERVGGKVAQLSPAAWAKMNQVVA